MKSMTGFGYGEFQDDKIHLTADLKSYNNRYLDLIVNIPPPLNPLEPLIRERISRSLKRGRVELYLRMRELEEDLTILLDKDAARGYADKLREMGRELSLKDDLGYSHILGLEGVLKVDKKRDLDLLSEKVNDLIDKALAELISRREKEGEKTEEDIMGQIALVESSLEKVKNFAPAVEEKITRTLQEKFREVLGDAVEEGRILQETASYLVRYDINEEISRLTTHLESFHSIVEKEEMVGKKLDFLCQEMNREINTIGSKTPQVEVSRLVVEMKDSMEKIREQLRNVE
ncbi:MAG: YicC family protein [Spirochaetales bacterium]|nr:YicC family protein [Spirochaetales bacterium]